MADLPLLEKMDSRLSFKQQFERVLLIGEAWRGAGILDSNPVQSGCPHHTYLTLQWGNPNSRRNIDLDENVLDNLQPPKCLKNLSIDQYMAARFAIWMNNVNKIFNLEKIKLTECLECETLLPFGQLPFLKSLYLHNMPKLKELPSLPSKLKRLEIDGIGWTTLNFCSNSNPIPLESLGVFHCPNITSLPLADEIRRLAALRYLSIITNCPNLISRGRYREVETTNNCHLMLSNLWISDPSVLLIEPLRSIFSLKELSISLSDELVSFPNEAEEWFLNITSSLCKLNYIHLASLQSLPSSESLSSLQELYIEDVPMLRELPNLPPSLKRLIIIGDCHPELKKRYREDGGSDRHKIAHIPQYDIRPR
ncbi:hypothetical protein KFK09_003846 [Dendrobium nobile]|uniref:R13L1/DRL21-like LRR repeat region domain-containing protein n=1 Tax=Dendrobium nobile TaxID=94219 RepID=A0A8T3BYS9_DENNO|nr:hypothetical protein KFK09_003846 [Dendrobium nobile]